MCMSLRLAHELLACARVILHDGILLDSQMTGLPGICKFNRTREARRGPDLFKPASCDYDQMKRLKAKKAKQAKSTRVQSGRE